MYGVWLIDVKCMSPSITHMYTTEAEEHVLLTTDTRQRSSDQVDLGMRPTHTLYMYV